MTSSRIAPLIVLIALLTILEGCARSPDHPIEIDAVFLIVVDTLRPDHLSCYGYSGHETPAIDGIAERGVLFTSAHSVASWTVPSMGAMLTSRYPTQLGLVEKPPDQAKIFKWRERRKQLRYTLPKGITTLASLLDAAGFHPVAFVNQPFINVQDGFLQGFAEWCYSTGTDSVAWHDVSVPIPKVKYPPKTDLGRADEPLVAEFSRWLANNADLRPFVWLHLLLPHTPYNPVLDFLPERLRRPGADVRSWHLYDAEIRETDARIAGVLHEIDTQVGLERSLIIFTSDHGEELFDHRMFEHGHSLHREVIQVPLIIAGPSLPQGRTVSGDVRLIDIVPTVLSLVGAQSNIPPDSEGQSLLPFIEGHGKSRVVYSEAMLYGSTERSLIADGFKLMYDSQASPPYLLYNTEVDAVETVNVAGEDLDRARRMFKELEEFHSRLLADYSATTELDTAQTDPETEAVRRAMRALGYVNQ